MRRTSRSCSTAPRASSARRRRRILPPIIIITTTRKRSNGSAFRNWRAHVGDGRAQRRVLSGRPGSRGRLAGYRRADGGGTPCGRPPAGASRHPQNEKPARAELSPPHPPGAGQRMRDRDRHALRRALRVAACARHAGAYRARAGTAGLQPGTHRAGAGTTRMKRFVALLLCTATVAVASAQESPTLRKIREAGMISIGYRESSVPFSYLDSAQRPVGYSMAICDRIVEAVRQRLGLADLE